MSGAPTNLGAHMLADAIARFHDLKSMGDRAMGQVDDATFFAASDAEANSIALVVKHVAGNLHSRWRSFLVEDGEKPDRDRDAEFEHGEADTREALVARWDEGWAILFAELGALGGDDLLRIVTIRHEPHTVVQCIHRQLTHYGYHVGQIVLLARAARGPEWISLSIPRRQSGTFNAAMKDRFSG